MTTGIVDGLIIALYMRLLMVSSRARTRTRARARERIIIYN